MADDIPEFLDRRPFVGTYTNLKTFRDTCEHQFYRRYIKRDQEYEETEAMKVGNAIHAAFDYRLSAKKPLPESMRHWERFAVSFDNHDVLAEVKLGMTAEGKQTGFFDRDVWFRGKADAVVLKPHSGLAYILDWKSGSSKYEDPFELETGALLVKIKYPEITRITGSYCWLKEERLGRQYDLSDFKRIFDEIQRLMALVAEKRRTNEWVKRKTGLCGYCSVSDCENWYKAR